MLSSLLTFFLCQRWRRINVIRSKDRLTGEVFRGFRYNRRFLNRSNPDLTTTRHYLTPFCDLRVNISKHTCAGLISRSILYRRVEAGLQEDIHIRKKLRDFPPVLSLASFCVCSTYYRHLISDNKQNLKAFLYLNWIIIFTPTFTPFVFENSRWYQGKNIINWVIMIVLSMS